jgi:hypothetical protein
VLASRVACASKAPSKSVRCSESIAVSVLCCSSWCSILLWCASVCVSGYVPTDARNATAVRH